MTKRRLALFVDGANNAEALNQAKVNMDFGKLLSKLHEAYELVSARYYSGYSTAPKHKNVRDFLASMSKKGFSLNTKPVKEFNDHTVKANMDVEIAVDMVTMAPRLDKIMLFSGDGDFCYAVDTVQRMGITVTVVSYKPFAAQELRNIANEFLDVEQFTETANY